MPRQGTNNCAPPGKDWWSLNRAFQILTYLLAESLKASPANCIIHWESHLSSTTGMETLGKETTGKEETLLLSFELLISIHQKTGVSEGVSQGPGFICIVKHCYSRHDSTSGVNSRQCWVCWLSSFKRIQQRWWARWLPCSPQLITPVLLLPAKLLEQNTLLVSLEASLSFIPKSFHPKENCPGKLTNSSSSMLRGAGMRAGARGRGQAADNLSHLHLSPLMSEGKQRPSLPQLIYCERATTVLIQE